MSSPALQLQPAPAPVNSAGAPLPFAEPPAKLNLKPAPRSLNLSPRPLNLAPRPLNLAPPPAAAAAPAAAPAAAGAGTVAGTVAGGAVVGVTVGELGRRQLVKQGFEGLAYPSDTVQQLTNPVDTVKRGFQGLAESYQEIFSPDDLASQPPPIPLSNPSDPPPFTGGQEAVLYTVFTQVTGSTTPGGDFVSGGFVGFVQGPLSISSGKESQPGGGVAGVIYLTDGNGNTSRVFKGPTFIPPATLDSFNGTISATRADGQPDTGGNPAPEAKRTPLAQQRFNPPQAGSLGQPFLAPPSLSPQPQPTPTSPPTPEAEAPTLPPQLQPPTPALNFPSINIDPLPQQPSSAPETTADPAETPEGQSISSSGKITRRLGNEVSTSTSTSTDLSTSPSPGSGSSGSPVGMDDLCNLPCITDIDAGVKNSNLAIKLLKELIEELLEEEGEGEIDIKPCGAQPEQDPTQEGAQENAGSIEWSGKGLEGVFSGIEAIGKALEIIKDCIDQGEGAGIAVPEWWAVRPGADIPQLAVTLREVNESGKLQKSQWSFSIPHYIGEEEEAPNIPPFKKGSYFATLTLSDNTKLVINAVSEEEAESVVNAIIPYIDPAFLGARDIRLGQRKGAALKEANVKPYRAHFYSEGQQNTIPDWSVDFDS